MNDPRWSPSTLLVVTLLLAARTGMAAGESSAPTAAQPTLGPWFAAGPFDTRQFDEVLPPEARHRSAGLGRWPTSLAATR